tara:strand:+ start:207 stop:614 length:408 start_codon:yes stop_codon:yes gene_type:complete
MTKKMIKHTGGCICGEVKYVVNLDEIPRVYNCHCIDCRKKLGGLNTIVEIRNGALEINKDKLGIYEHPGGSGNKIQKFYCKKCIAPVYSYVGKWDKIYLYAGLLDDISILKKVNNIWYKDSHFPFMEVTENKIKT